MRKILSGLLMVVVLAPAAGSARQAEKPKQVRTCADIRAFVDDAGTMSMDDFKVMLERAGLDVNARARQTLDNYCAMVPRAQNVILSQHVLDLPGGEARVNAKVVIADGQCRLTNISVLGCGG
jgi:hypothetical protein